MRTWEDVADVGDGLCVSEKVVVEDAGGGMEGGEVDDRRVRHCKLFVASH